MKTNYNVADHVDVIGIGSGWISKIRFDSCGAPIYTVLMENPTSTGDDFYARECELERI